MAPGRSRTESILQTGNPEASRALKSFGGVGQNWVWDSKRCLASVLSSAFSERGPESPYSDRLYVKCEPQHNKTNKYL